MKTIQEIRDKIEALQEEKRDSEIRYNEGKVMLSTHMTEAYQLNQQMCALLWVLGETEDF